MVLANWGRSVGIVCALVALAVVALWFMGGTGAPPPISQHVDGAKDYYISFYAQSDTEAARIEKKLTDKGYTVTDSVSTGILAGHTLIIQQPFTLTEFTATIFKLSKEVGNKDWSADSMQAQTYLADMSKGKYSYSRMFILAVGSASAAAARALLWVFALSAGAAALLALLLLTRGTPSPAILWLGLGLGAWSLGVAYLWLYSIVPVFGAWQPDLLSLRLVLDTAAMLLILLACHAYIRFWKGFPQPVSDAELDRFLAQQKAEQLAKAGIAASRTGEAPASPAPGMRRWLWPALAILVTVCTGLSWTGVCVALLNHPFFGVPAFLLDVFFYVLLIYWPGITCLRVFRYHRALGSAEDCRRIEWIRASIWLGFVAVVLPLCVLAVVSVGDYFWPVFWDLEEPAKAFVMFGLSAGPLFVIIAVAISIFYKGTIDPRLALRQVTLWSLVGVIVTLGFVLVERSVAVKVAEWAHLSPQTGYVTAGALVAASFQPIRKRAEVYVNRFVERALPGQSLSSDTHRVAPAAEGERSGYPGLAAKEEQSRRSG